MGLLDLQEIRNQCDADRTRFENLGFTNDDANSYYNAIFRGVPEAKAEEQLFAGRSLTADDRLFVLDLLSYGKPDPNEWR